MEKTKNQKKEKINKKTKVHQRIFYKTAPSGFCFTQNKLL